MELRNWVLQFQEKKLIKSSGYAKNWVDFVTGLTPG